MALPEDLSPGIRLIGFPASGETVNTSPPVNPSSLISPWMNPMVEPSGDHRGMAICVSGLKISISFPDATGIVKSLAIHQLLSAGPGAALTANLRPPGDPSHSQT